MKKIKVIKQNAVFARLYKKGTSIVCPTFVCYVKKHKGEDVFLGLTASKKIGGAVERNRAKRVLRVAARYLYDKGLRGVQMLLVARTKTTFVKSDRVCRELEAALIKSGFLNSEAAK